MNTENALAPIPIVPPQSVINRLMLLAKAVAESRAYGVANWQHAFSLMMIGLELGVPPMQSLREIRTDKGKVSISADLMAARVRALKLGKIEIVAYTDDIVTIRFVRNDEPDKALTLTWDNARVEQAGLHTKDNHKKYPRQLKESRCTAEGVRLLYPEASGSIYTPEELGASFAFEHDAGDDEVPAIVFEDSPATPDRFKSLDSTTTADAPAQQESEATRSTPASGDTATTTSTPPNPAPSQTPSPVASPAAVATPTAVANTATVPDRFAGVAKAPVATPSSQSVAAEPPIAPPCATAEAADNQSKASSVTSPSPTAENGHAAMSITPLQTDAIAKLYQIVAMPLEIWRKKLIDAYGVDTIRLLSASQTKHLIIDLIGHCSTPDGMIRRDALTEEELAALGISFPLPSLKPVAADAPKAQAATTAATNPTSDSPTRSTDSADQSSTSPKSEAA